MTAPVDDTLALAARLVVAADILDRHPCEVVWLARDCREAAAALRAIPIRAAPMASDVVGWLIESENRDGKPVYWTLKPGSEDDWTDNATDALRFARREDADHYAGYYLDSDGPPCRIVEHMWCAPPAHKSPDKEHSA